MNYLKKHVACAISGGVDSAIAAYLLKKDGFKVTGCYMKNWDKQNETDDCSTASICQSDKDKNDAKYVCEKLNIDFVEFDFSRHYWNNVFSDFLTDYENGLTPNPDILCNKYIKFPIFYDFCKNKLENVNYIATGHYARLYFDPLMKKYKLLKSVDHLKDQTFFLSQIDPKLFQHILFPIGSLEKHKVRNIAKEIGLERIWHKKGSVGICFIGKRNFSEFIDQYLQKNFGKIIDIDTNNVIGEHNGIHHYTIGQRLHGPLKIAHSKPYFIARKDFKTQNLFVAMGTDHPALYFNEFYVSEPHWLCDNYEANSFKCIQNNEIEILDSKFKFKFQHKHEESEIIFLKKILNSDKKSNAKYLVRTKLNIRGITPGQFAVFYNGDECIGSARIIDAPLSLFDLKFDGALSNTDKLLVKNY